MSDTVKVVIEMPKDKYAEIKRGINHFSLMAYAIRKGTPLPKGHGRLIDENEILRFLKCPEYETCDWKNCFDCNKSRCINLNNVNRLASIIEADKKGEDRDEI